MEEENRYRHRTLRGRWVLRSLFRRGKTYHARVRDARTGIIRQKTTGETRRDDAEQKALEWVEELESRGEGEIVERRFSEVASDWLELRQPEIRKTTYDGLSSCVELYKRELGHFLVDTLIPADIETFLSTLAANGRGERTRRKHLAQIRRILEWAVDNGYSSQNPAERIRAPRPGRPDVAQVLNVDEARRLLQFAAVPVVVEFERSGHQVRRTLPAEPAWIGFLIALHTGLRRGNVAGLTWRHVSLSSRRIDIPASEMKGRRKHSVPIHPELADVLARVRRERSPTADDSIVGTNGRTLASMLERTLTRADLPAIRFHDLRHTWGTWLASRVPYAVQRRLLGHAADSVTLHYSHVQWPELVAGVETIPRLLNEESAEGILESS